MLTLTWTRRKKMRMMELFHSKMMKKKKKGHKGEIKRANRLK